MFKIASRFIRSSLTIPQRRFPLSHIYMRNINANRFYFSKNNQNNQLVPKPEKPKEQPTQPHLLKEIYTSIKIGTSQTFQSVSQKLKKNTLNFKDEANQYEQDISTAKTFINIIKLAWKKTFPDDELIKNKMERMKKTHANIPPPKKRIYTEEEIKKIQELIPEWKRTALMIRENPNKQEKPQLKRRKIREILGTRFQQSSFAKSIMQTEQYKEYQTFKKVMKEFKQDAKLQVQSHPSNFIQGSLFLYETATKVSDTAKCIQLMREQDPLFDLFELERDSKLIFQNTFNAFLRNDLDLLTNVCGEQALSYFKFQLQKMKSQLTEPKFKQLWNLDNPMFQKAAIFSKLNLPVFIFKVNTQQIYCYVSSIEKQKIIEGDESRVISTEYIFALSPHSSPSIAEVGHKWQLLEIQPVSSIKLLI